jgi:hypothetical protein
MGIAATILCKTKSLPHIKPKRELKNHFDNTYSLIEGWCKKKLVLPNGFCPPRQFGSIPHQAAP